MTTYLGRSLDMPNGECSPFDKTTNKTYAVGAPRGANRNGSINLKGSKMPPIGSVHVSGISYRDATDEVGSFEFFHGAITTTSIAGFLTNFGALQTATDAITLGVRSSQFWTGDRTTVSNAIPTNPAAQREARLRVKYMDDVTEQQYTLTIPTIDFSKLVFVAGGKDAVVFSGAGANADIVAWVTAFETIARSPDSDLNTVTVVKMRFIGQNS